MSRNERPEGYESPDHTSTTEFRLPEKRVAGSPAEEAPVAEPVAETVTDRPLDQLRGEAAADPSMAETPAAGIPSATPPVEATAAEATAVEATAVETPSAAATAVDRTIGDTVVRPAGSPHAAEEDTAVPIAMAATRPPDDGTDMTFRTEEVTWESPSPGAPAADATVVQPDRFDSPSRFAPPGPMPPFGRPGEQDQTGQPGQSDGSGHVGQDGPPAVFGQPPSPPMSGPRPEQNRRLMITIAAAAVVVLIALGAAAAFLWPKSQEADGGAAGAGPEVTRSATPSAGGPTAPETGAPPTEAPTGNPTGGAQPPASIAPGGPDPNGPGTETGPGAPTAAPAVGAPVGPVVRGQNLTYQLMEQDQGYFEGTFTITNPTAKPMSSWSLTFTAAQANVKTVWGGRLVRGGARPTIQNLPDAPAIPPGGSLEVRFGAEGSPSDPEDCRLNKKGCGF